MHVYDAADVWAHGVDGSVGAETCGVDSQVGGALVDHISDDVDLHLVKTKARCFKDICSGCLRKHLNSGNTT